jgi:hypothetical protein
MTGWAAKLRQPWVFKGGGHATEQTGDRRATAAHSEGQGIVRNPKGGREMQRRGDEKTKSLTGCGTGNICSFCSPKR